MDLGVFLPTKAKSWEDAQRAEELGCSHVWFYDTQLLSADVLVAMGASAMKTSRIKLCAGVFIPSNRNAAVAANGLATLNALAPGRVVFGTSTGYTGRRTMGLGPVTLARLEKYVQAVEGLLQGKTVEWSEEGGTHKIRFLNPDLGLINIKDRIPTFLSAFGPKARSLTAKLGAGWIGSASYPQREQAEIEEFRAGWRQNGRDVKDVYAVCEMRWLRARRRRGGRWPPCHGAGRSLRGHRISQPCRRRPVRLGFSGRRTAFRSRPNSKLIEKCIRHMNRPTRAISPIIAAI